VNVLRSRLCAAAYVLGAVHTYAARCCSALVKRFCVLRAQRSFAQLIDALNYAETARMCLVFRLLNDRFGLGDTRVYNDSTRF